MTKFDEYLNKIDDADHLGKLEDLFAWIEDTFPTLQQEYKWNTPMYSDHGTFIIGISTAKAHMSIAPENQTMAKFKDAIDEAGYSQTAGLFRVKWNQEINYDLLKAMIEFNIEDKKDCETFWRK